MEWVAISSCTGMDDHFFLWVELSGALAQEKNDFVQPEIDVEIGNSSNRKSHLFEAEAERN